MPSNELYASVRTLLQPLADALATPGLTDLCFNKPGRFYMEVDGRWTCVEAVQLTLAWARALVVAAATAEGKHVGEQAPFLSAALPGGLRLQAVLPPACRAERLLLAFRAPATRPVELSDFDWTLAPSGPPKRSRPPSKLMWEAGHALRDAVHARQNIVVVGETGSGKSAALRSLIYRIQEDERVVTIEDVHEIVLVGQNSAQLLYGETTGITATRCLREALRLRPDRIILNECRGAEAFDFLQALMSGHRGSMTTFHADSVAGALERFALMARMHPSAAQLTPDLLVDLAKRNIDCIIRTVRNARGARRIAEVKWIRH